MRKRKSAFLRALEQRRDAARQQAAEGANEREDDHEARPRTPWLPRRRRPYWK